MTMDPLFAYWDWEDPDALAATFEKLTADLARCETLDLIARRLPVTRQDFLDIGLTGIEFAAFKTRHPAGLGTDLVGLHTPTMTTEPGLLYRADGTSYFTQLDIAEKLPFGDGCVDWVYAEHLIEHVPPLVAISWLTEVRRILTPGGLLRITTPDLSKYAQGYVTGDSFFAKQRRRLRIMRFGPPMPERRAFMLNQIFYPPCLPGGRPRGRCGPRHGFAQARDDLRRGHRVARGLRVTPEYACGHERGRTLVGAAGSKAASTATSSTPRSSASTCASVRDHRSHIMCSDATSGRFSTRMLACSCMLSLGPSQVSVVSASLCLTCSRVTSPGEPSLSPRMTIARWSLTRQVTLAG